MTAKCNTVILIATITSCVIFVTTCLNGANCLVINNLYVPEVIRNGSESAVVLDCDYSLGDDEKGLVVKWFFNNDPSPVYQWIYTKKPQDLGVLKGKLNLEYRASEDSFTMHRALQILNPTIELSGEYKCLVSTFEEETSSTKKMIVFVPEKSLVVTQTKQNGNSAVNITCTAEGVFPEPKLAIVTEARTDDTLVYTTTRNGVYDIVATLVVEDKNLESPTTFDCELKIPEANYTVKKSSVYYPGPPTTTTPAPPETSSDMPDANLATSEPAAASRSLATWTLMLTAILCLRL